VREEGVNSLGHFKVPILFWHLPVVAEKTTSIQVRKGRIYSGYCLSFEILFSNTLFINDNTKGMHHNAAHL
jgi:hypothetical protein